MKFRDLGKKIVTSYGLGVTKWGKPLSLLRPFPNPIQSFLKTR